MPEVTQDQLAELEVRVEDLSAEIQYQTSRISRILERVEDALRDIQGVNLEQRIRNIVTQENPPTSQSAASLWSPGGTHPVVQSEQSVPTDSGIGYVADGEAVGPDEGADQSETGSPEALDEEF